MATFNDGEQRSSIRTKINASITKTDAMDQGVATTDDVEFASVNGRDVAADGSKLDGIEAGATADQTAGEIKTAYESNADTNAFTDAEQSKLSGIEAGATADQTAGEIKTAYESNADTNAFTDAEQSKLSGIEAGADVTDTANVTAAGALMESELTSEASVKGLDQGVATTDSPEFAGLTVDTDTLYVDSANNRVGIGTSSPSSILELSEDNPTLRWTDTTGGYAEIACTSGQMRLRADAGNTQATSIFQFEVDGSEAMRIDPSGRVGIGTSSPGEALSVQSGSFNSDVARFTGGVSDRGLVVSTFVGDGFSDAGVDLQAVRDLSFTTNNSEAMRIDSSGNVLVGKTAPSTDQGVSLFANGAIRADRNDGSSCLDLNAKGTTSNAARFYKDQVQVGSITVTTSSTSYNTSSDERLKENITGADDASALIDGIQVRQFDWRADGEHQRYGMIAQELDTVAPEAVTKGETEDDMWAVDYSKLVPMLVKEIQDLRKRVEELENTQ